MRTERATDRLFASLAADARATRRRRKLTLDQVAQAAGLSRASVVALEGGGRVSVAAAVAIATAIGLELEMALIDPRRRHGRSMAEDPVHAALGEIEAARLASQGRPVAIDEPYQHYQFAGRADLMSWALDAKALLHVENRTRFPNIGEVAGAWNAKRRWLGPETARRIGITRFDSETHVMVALWSAEVLHELRRRPATFRALAPDPPDAWAAWWDGTAPRPGRTSTLVLLDPFATGRKRPWIGLDEALDGARPRVRGYAEAAALVTRR